MNFYEIPSSSTSKGGLPLTADHYAAAANRAWVPTKPPFKRPVPQFPPTPQTVVKPPRFYPNRPASPKVSSAEVAASSIPKNCICDRPPAMIICRKYVRYCWFPAIYKNMFESSLVVSRI